MMQKRRMTPSDSGHSPDGDGIEELFLTARKRVKHLKDTSMSVERSLELLHKDMKLLKEQVT